MLVRHRWTAAVTLAVALLGCAGLRAGPPADERLVAVTFDDLPLSRLASAEQQSSVTRRLLDALRRHEVPAIGFVNESKLYVEGALDDGRVALLAAWLEAGFELGNHTFSHRDLHRVPLEAYLEEIVRGERVTRELAAGFDWPVRFFRHPYLHTGRTLADKRSVERFLEERGYRVAPVTIDNSEWIFARAYERAVGSDPQQAALVAEVYVPYLERYFAYYEQQSRALFGREIPQILLLHANALNAETLGTTARMIADRGYRFVTLERALEDEAFASRDEYVGPGGISWIHRWALSAETPAEFFHGEPAVPDWVSELAGVDP